jgi:hypothetical protein
VWKEDKGVPTTDMTVCVEHPMRTTERLLELVSEFNKVQDTKLIEFIEEIIKKAQYHWPLDNAN